MVSELVKNLNSIADGGDLHRSTCSLVFSSLLFRFSAASASLVFLLNYFVQWLKWWLDLVGIWWLGRWFSDGVLGTDFVGCQLVLGCFVWVFWLLVWAFFATDFDCYLWLGFGDILGAVFGGCHGILVVLGCFTVVELGCCLVKVRL